MQAARVRVCKRPTLNGDNVPTLNGDSQQAARMQRASVFANVLPIPTLNGDSVATLNGDRKLNRWIEEEEGREPILNAK